MKNQLPDILPDLLDRRAHEQRAATTSAVRRAADILGTSAELARRLGVTPGRVSQWMNTDPILADYCLKIERLTDGRVRCEELRPDLDWAVVRESWKQAA